MLSYAMVTHPTGNTSLAATPAVVKVARTRLPMPTRHLGVRRCCTPTKNEAVSVASLAPLASLAPRCLVGSKKGVQLPPFRPTLVVPDPADPASTTLELDERMARLCSKKHPTSGWGWPCAARGGRWSLTRWVIGVKKPVCACGRPFHQPIAGGIVLPISGRYMQQ